MLHYFIECPECLHHNRRDSEHNLVDTMLNCDRCDQRFKATSRRTMMVSSELLAWVLEAKQEAEYARR